MSGVSSFAKKAAPWIATIASAAVPGAAPLIGIAAKLLSDGLGKEVKPTADAVSEAVTSMLSTPEQIAALKKIDNDFALQMKSLDIQDQDTLAKIAADDMASARIREETIRDWMPRTLGVGVIGGFLVSVFLILLGHAKADSVIAGTLVGYLSAKSELVLAYYFGSSAGSDRKTELLAQK